MNAGCSNDSIFIYIAQQFGQWCESYIEIEPTEWVAIDGKSIKGTVSEAQTTNPELCKFGVSI